MGEYKYWREREKGENKMLDVRLSDELLHECQGLLYRKWAEAHDEISKVAPLTKR